MNNRDRIILNKILSEIHIIEQLVDEITQEDFKKCEKTKKAASMTLINIGELVKSLSEELRSKNDNIPWKSIAGMRDIVAHKYQTLKMRDVWNTLKTDIPILKSALLKILKDQNR